MGNPKVIDPWYFSYWRFSLYKECPKKFDLLTRGSQEIWDGSGEMDKRFALEGAVVHNVMEKIGLRKLGKYAGKVSVEAELDSFLSTNNIVMREDESSEKILQTCIGLVGRTIEIVKMRNMLEGLYGVELKLKAKIGRITLGGRVDWIQRISGLFSISDWKLIGRAENCELSQLLFYWLLLEHSSDPTIKGEVGSAYFVMPRLDPFLKGLGKRSDKRIQNLVDDLETVATKIENGDFEAKCSDYNCRYCNVRNYCIEFRDMFPSQIDYAPEGDWKF